MIDIDDLEVGRKCVLARPAYEEEKPLINMVVVLQERSTSPWCVVCSEGDRQLARWVAWYEESNGTIVLDLESLEYYEECEPDAF